LKHPKYQSWLRESGSAWLWVTADPGCGKSVLSRYLVDDFTKTQSDSLSVCYFFFKDDSDLTRSATHALCAILHQLFSQRPALLRKHALDQFKMNGAKLTLLFETLWGIFLSAVTDPEVGDVLCIFDALDECDENTRFTFTNSMAGFYHRSKQNENVKFLFTSRPNSGIRNAFWREEWDENSIRLMGENEAEIEAISIEIKLVVEARVKQFSARRKSLGIQDDAMALLQSTLDKIQNRTYLWIALIFPELEKKASWSKNQLLKVIKSIPSTVDSAYERILNQSTDIELARRLLHIIVAARQPLTLVEMNVALHLNNTVKTIEELNQELMTEPVFRHNIKEICGLFVTIQDSRVYLIHQTAKEFLIQQEQTTLEVVNVASQTTSWKHSLFPATSEYILAEICIRYLQMEQLEPTNFVFSSPAEKYYELCFFFSYAAHNWARHFRQLGYDQQHSLTPYVLDICSTNSFRLPMLIMLRSGWKIKLSTGLSSLSIASYEGLENIVKVMLDNGADVNSYDRDGNTPLNYAVEKGHEAIVRLLLEKGANVQAKDGTSNPALVAAVHSGSEGIAKLLLAIGADIEGAGKYGDTPLLSAVRYGNENVINLLLDKGANIEGADKYDDTPLHSAIRCGKANVITLLLERGANIKSQTEDGKTPLDLAIQEGNTDIVKLLSEYHTRLSNEMVESP
jgi:ankyrin repeat protein